MAKWEGLRLIDEYAKEYGDNRALTEEHSQMCEDAIKPMHELLDNKQSIGEVSISLEHTNIMLGTEMTWSRLKSKEIMVCPE